MGSRLTRIATALILLVLVLGPKTAHASSLSLVVEEPAIRGSAAILIDSSLASRSKSLLWEKASSEKRSIASLTKLVTALVVVDRTKMEEMVTASTGAEAIGALDPLVTELELRAGEQMSVRNLLYGLLMISANDAAIALAEHVGGSVESFVTLMNRKAKELGAKDTQFRNPHGFDQEGHHSTAKDLSMFALALMAHDELRQMVGTKSFEIRRQSGVNTTLANRNLLLGSFEGTTGIKTGQTRASGRALVASATRGTESRIAIVLGSTDAFADAKVVLDYGFKGFRRIDVARAGRTWGYVTFGDGRTMRLVPRSSGSYLIGADESDPQVHYDSRNRQIVTSFDTSANRPRSAVRVIHQCVGSCEEDRSRGLGWLWAVLSPLARIMAAL